ncbi:MAG TPA: 16S rRNA (guanine(966)-N(2))-methyltransferase RsmD [Chthoniobacterales bacterium]|nr:16S rRNA (guanine(966)-N(2))-methyltransferase RsmD [Chthoniobacterales bacterium]
MRVVGGSAGGIQLAVPKRGVRPTMDRVKAAIFSSLRDRTPGARVLDLFAGAGALGIEALSRGAASALLVDQDRQAILAIKKNLAKTKLDGRLRQQEVFRFLLEAGAREKFDIIFADPPYDKMETGESFIEKLLSNKQLGELLDADGIFVLEKRPDENLPDIKPWHIVRAKTYGATEVLFLQK